MPTVGVKMKHDSSQTLVKAKRVVSPDPNLKLKKQNDLKKSVQIITPKRVQRNRLNSRRKKLVKVSSASSKKFQNKSHETPAQLRRRLGMIGDMRNLNLIPSEILKTKLKYYYTAYNKKNLKTHYMTFDEARENFTEEGKDNGEDEGNSYCWKLIADFVLKAEHKQFQKVIGKFRKREVLEMKNNIKRSREVFKKIALKNRRFGRLFQKVRFL